MRNRWSRDKLLHLAYDIGIWFKGIDGLFEMIGGVLLLLASKAALGHLVRALTQHELSEDPTDWVATHLQAAVRHLSSNTKTFASAYLLGHGALKAFLVWGGLMKRKLWAFPTTLILMAAFIGYQTYRVLHRFSLGLAALTIIDFLVVLLIWREYRVVKRELASKRT